MDFYAQLCNVCKGICKRIYYGGDIADKEVWVCGHCGGIGVIGSALNLYKLQLKNSKPSDHPWLDGYFVRAGSSRDARLLAFDYDGNPAWLDWHQSDCKTLEEK